MAAPPAPLIIFTCTWYPSTEDLRFLQCVETLEAAREHSCPAIVVVDGSPSKRVHEALRSTGTIVHKQTFSGGKGAALREAAGIAADHAGASADTLLCWQEPEKTDMIRLWAKVHSALKPTDDVVVPRRTQQSFQSSYPIEQFYSESYGNLYLDAVMKNAIQGSGDAASAIVMPRADTDTPRGTSILDWHFGPFAFRAKHVDLWTKYTGSSYDAQIVPYVHGIRKGLSVCGVDVDFVLDEKMRQQEEGNAEFIEKRLNQLNELDPKVKAAWTDDLYC